MQQTLTGHASEVHSLAVWHSPIGATGNDNQSLLCSCDDDATIRLWRRSVGTAGGACEASGSSEVVEAPMGTMRRARAGHQQHHV